MPPLEFGCLLVKSLLYPTDHPSTISQDPQQLASVVYLCNASPAIEFNMPQVWDFKETACMQDGMHSPCMLHNMLLQST